LTISYSDVLQAAQPDIVILQEVGSVETAEFFAQALDFSYYFAFAQGNTRKTLALLSRFPIVKRQSYHPWPIHATLLDATIAYEPGRQLHVCGVHLIAFHFIGGRLYRWALKPLLAAGYRDCFRTLHPDKAGFTLPAGATNSRLDYIFAQGSLKEQLKTCNVWQEPAAAAHASDHYPVMAIFDV
jgi:exonuclease III